MAERPYVVEITVRFDGVYAKSAQEAIEYVRLRGRVFDHDDIVAASAKRESWYEEPES